jgi:hypothetical protein
MTADYLLEHFKWTDTSEGKWLLIEVKPVCKRTWGMLKKYALAHNWELKEASGVRFFVLPCSNLTALDDVKVTTEAKQ